MLLVVNFEVQSPALYVLTSHKYGLWSGLVSNNYFGFWITEGLLGLSIQFSSWLVISRGLLFFFGICSSFTTLWKKSNKMTAISKNSNLVVTTSNASLPLLWANSGYSSPNGTVQDSLPFLFRLALPFQVSSEACNENMLGRPYFHTYFTPNLKF